MAVFKALRPNGVVRLFPVEIYMLVLLLGICNTFASFAIFLITPNGFNIWTLNVNAFVWGVLVFTPTARVADKCRMNRQTLNKQLESFRIEA